MKTIQFLLALVVAVTATLSACGTEPDASDVTATEGAVIQDTSSSSRRYMLDTYLRRPSPLKIVTADSTVGNMAAGIPGVSYWVPVRTLQEGVGLTCDLYMNWASGGWPSSYGAAPAGIPYIRASGATHWVAVTGSQCKIDNGAYFSVVGAAELWETAPPLGNNVGDISAYLVWKFGAQGYLSPQRNALTRFQ